MKIKFLGKYIMYNEDTPLEFNHAIFYRNTRVNLFNDDNEVICTFIGFCKTEYELEGGDWTPESKTPAEVNVEQDELIAEIIEGM